MTIVHCDYKPNRPRNSKPAVDFPSAGFVTAKPPRTRHYGEIRGVPDEAQRVEFIRQFMAADVLPRRTRVASSAASQWPCGDQRSADGGSPFRVRSAPATGNYEELNVFGSHTGKVVYVAEGDQLPPAPRSFTWRRMRREPE